MSPKSKEENKVVLDLAAWLFNIVTSVGIIIVNKTLMANYGFTFGKSAISSPVAYSRKKKACIDNYDFKYGQLLNILLILHY